jgi:hypothetical protein
MSLAIHASWETTRETMGTGLSVSEVGHTEYDLKHNAEFIMNYTHPSSFKNGTLKSGWYMDNKAIGLK